MEMLAALLSGFGWVLVIIVCAALVAYLYSGEMLEVMCAAAPLYEGLDVEDIAVIEEARAELAQKARERAEKAAKEAETARLDALAEAAFYVPAWAGRWEAETADRLRRASIPELTRVPGIGEQRARSIVEAGDSLTWEMLRAICTRPVAHRASLLF